MARRPTEVAASLRGSIAAVNPTIDTEIGPIPDVFITPQASEISTVEGEIDILALRYSVDYVKTLSDADIALFGANHGLRRSVGTPARGASGAVSLFTYAPPRSGQVFSIPTGTLVATTDTKLVYATTTDVTVTSDTIALYYNAARRRYEVPVTVQAQGVGDEYAVPPGRITALLSPLPNFNGVVQTRRIDRGLTATTNDTFMETCRKTLVGSALGSLAGLEAVTLQFGEGAISDVSLVFSSDPIYFRRPTHRAACDVWILGTEPRDETDTQVAQAGQTVVYPSIQPVLSVTDVAVDGLAVPFTYVKDVQPSTSNSVRASDRVVLSTPLTLGQIVTMRYTYDGMIQSLQAYYDDRTASTQPASAPVVRSPRLYQCDLLARSAIRVPVRVVVSLLVLSSYDEVRAADDATAAILEYVNPTVFTPQLLPEDVRSAVANAAIGASSVSVLEFQRTDRTGLRVDALEFAPNEIPYADATTVTVRIRRT